jgi:PAS domain S-box-containing protein
VTAEALKILLVEDDVGFARRIERHLCGAPNLRAVVVGKKALADAQRAILESDWDLVLLDLRLPDSQGIPTLRAIRQLTATPIVALVEARDARRAQEAVQEGAQDYLPKRGLSAELLNRTVRYAIERSRTERSLDEERRRLFEVLDALPMFVFLQSPDQTIPFANRMFHDLFGDTEGRPCYEVFSGHRKPCDECHPMRVQETGEPQISEWTSAAGRTYAMYHQVFPGPGSTALTLGVGLDITEQKHAQQELARSEARFRRLAENAPDIIYRYRITPKPRFDYISPAIAQVTGYTPEEYYADPLLGMKIVHPDDRHFLDRLSHGRLPAKLTYDVRWIHKDGHIRWTEDHYIPIYDGSGRLVAVEGVARDITEWKLAQEALAKSEERYRLLFEHASIGIGYYTPKGAVIGYNRVAASRLGGTPADFAGKTILELYGEERGRKHLQRVVDAARTSETVTYEDYAELPTGPKWLLTTYSRIEGPDGNVAGVQVLSEEITDRKASEAALVGERERLFAVLDTLPAFVYLQAQDHSIPFANRRFVEIFGDPEGQACYRVLVGREVPCRRCSTLAVLETGATIGRDWTSDKGRTYELHEQLFPVEDGTDMVLVIGMDITERRRAAEALETADEIVSTIPSGILIYQYQEPDELLLVSGNPAASSAFNVEETTGKGLESQLPPPMAARLKPPLLAVAREGGVYDKEVTVDAPEGRYDFHVRAFRIPAHRVVIVFEDIRGQREAERALAESEARARAVLDAVPDLFFQLDREGRFVLYHAPQEQLYVPEDRFLGKRIDEVLPPDVAEAAFGALQRVLDTGKMESMEYSLPIGSEWRDYEARLVRSGDEEEVLVIVRDITVRRQVIDALQTADQIVRSIPAGMFIYQYEPPDRLVLVDSNAEAERLTDITLAEWKGKEFNEIWPNAKRAGITDSFLNALRSGTVFRTEDLAYEDPHIAGTYRIRAFGIPSARLVVSFEDVSELMRTERELRESEIRYRSLFENAVLGIYRTAPDGRILAANPAFVRMLGCDSFEELTEWSLEEEEDGTPTLREEFNGEVKRLGSLVRRESAWKRKDGTTIYVRENARAVCDGEGNVLYHEGTIEDITDRKDAEREAEALRAQLELTQFSIDSTDVIVLWALPDGRFTFANEAACRMLGYTQEELLSMAMWDIDTEYQKECRSAAWNEVKRVGNEVLESTFRRKSGETFPVEITAQYLEFRGRELEFAVAFDISERKRLEAELRQSQKLESIGTLASGVAHEINNPLTGIINYAQLISDRVESAKLKEFADGVKEEGERVAKIVRNLLSFSRREKEHHSPARMSDIVHASLSLFAALLQRDHIELEVDVSEDLPEISCRSQEIQQVVINLLTNARDSLNLRFPDEHDDKRIVIRARVLEEDSRRWLRLSVEDRGQGIAPEIMDRIFDPFFTTKLRDQGTGLGLWVSFGLVREHGGRMTVESVPDEGTRFFVDLPSDAG